VGAALKGYVDNCWSQENDGAVTSLTRIDFWTFYQDISTVSV